jgi:hypothetical protein
MIRRVHRKKQKPRITPFTDRVPISTGELKAKSILYRKNILKYITLAMRAIPRKFILRGYIECAVQCRAECISSKFFITRQRQVYPK